MIRCRCNESLYDYDNDYEMRTGILRRLESYVMCHCVPMQCNGIQRRHRLAHVLRSDWFITDFIKTCEEEIDVNHGAVAVHCRAGLDLGLGLGRTGCMICAYLIYKYNIEPRTAIAWVHLIRVRSDCAAQDLSVIGPQQQFLEDLKPRLTLMMAG